MVLLHLLIGFLAGLGLTKLLIFTARAERKLTSFDFVALLPSKKAYWFLYLLFGALTSLLFYLNLQVFGDSGRMIFWQLLTVLLIAAALYDLAFRLIPVFLIGILIILVSFISFQYSLPLPFYDSTLGAMVVGGAILFLYLITRGRGIGEADIFIGYVIGALFGWVKGLLVFSAANIFGLLLLLPLIALFGKARMKRVPLVFFLVLAIFLEWYLGYSEWILMMLEL